MDIGNGPYKKRLCKLFQAGSCVTGASCTFAHGNKDLRSFENPLYKAQLCTAFEQGGMCKMGHDCLFAHGEGELRTDDVQLNGADAITQDIAPQQKPTFKTSEKKGAYKSALCIHFMKNASCHLGASCTFAHGKEELTNVSPPDTSDPKYKTKLCLRYEQEEFCPNGEFCVFAHGEAELKSQANSSKKIPLYKTNLCHNFSTLGVCPSGKNCSFAHGRFELRPVGFDGDFEAKIAENPKWKCVQCKIFLQSGHCNRVNCDYAHGEQELRTELPEAPKIIRGNYKTVLCNNYAMKGFCFHEDSCTFAHGQHELNTGKDAASALKMIRDTTVRKRPKTEMTQVPNPLAAHINPYVAATASYTDQKLFAEFLEFKKMKQHPDVTGNVASFFNANQPQLRAAAAAAGLAALPGGYEPLKVMNNATGQPIAVTDLVGAAHQPPNPSFYHHPAAANVSATGYHDDMGARGLNKREPLRSRYATNTGGAGMKLDRTKMYTNRVTGMEAEYPY